MIILEIIVSIVGGGLFGFITGIILGSFIQTGDELALHAVYYGAIIGLIILLIWKVNNLTQGGNHEQK
ncbi:hypothetical protein CEY16_12870 [Halalkalibacillus sediminis]|uniref:Uncharacterized protein n=1 Tax=Halalkalibacillus sediminis TaxID=2018042 RepID=A0A2I0QQT8_9BACI|nr:hypothetical protein [Halalkalibacillus sediminis]PKR76705.1 hypothetical protein CEY16_12870 [Halalkalibacillus sediminis]